MQAAAGAAICAHHHLCRQVWLRHHLAWRSRSVAALQAVRDTRGANTQVRHGSTSGCSSSSSSSCDSYVIYGCSAAVKLSGAAGGLAAAAAVVPVMLCMDVLRLIVRCSGRSSSRAADMPYTWAVCSTCCCSCCMTTAGQDVCMCLASCRPRALAGVAAAADAAASAEHSTDDVLLRQYKPSFENCTATAFLAVLLLQMGCRNVHASHGASSLLRCSTSRRRANVLPLLVLSRGARTILGQYGARIPTHAG
jgi:hypothetical protein